MGLNEVVLSNSVIATLYKNSLVESDEKMATPVLYVKESIKPIQYLGKNFRDICLLVNYETDVYLPDEQLIFLGSILQACKLNIADVAIVNYHLQKTSFEDLKKLLACKYLLVFGIDIVQLGLQQMPEFSPQNISDCFVIISPAPEQLNNNSTAGKLLKSKLWLCLKQLFNV